MANGQLNLGKQSGGVLSLAFPDGATNTEVALPESGTVASVDGAVTDNAIARYDGTTGKLQDSGVIIEDSGNITCKADSSSRAITLLGRSLDNSAGIYLYSNDGSTYLGSITKNMTNGLNRTTIDSSGTNAYFEIRLNNQVKAILDTSGNFLLNSGTGGIGYGTGAGGTVTQLTSKSTAVTLNKPCGVIITHNAALAAGATVSFSLSNSLIRYTDTVAVELGSGTYTPAAYNVWTYVINGVTVIHIKNISSSSIAESIPLNFSLIKGAIS